MRSRYTNPRDVSHYSFILRTPLSIDINGVDEIKYGPFRCIETGEFLVWAFKYDYSYLRFAAAYPTINADLRSHQHGR